MHSMITAQEGTYPNYGIWDVYREFVKNEGIFALYKGVSLNIE